MTIEEKLRTLAECGLTLDPPFGISDLEESWGREALDEPGYNLALVCLGMTQESPPWTPHCKNLWHFDTECIDGDGSYVSIADRMAEMTQRSLVLSELQDEVDLDAGHAWLRFNCQGQAIHIDCEVQDDWVDPGIFKHFTELLAQVDPDKLFVYYDLGGQDCILGCVTRDQFQRLQGLLPAIKSLS